MPATFADFVGQQSCILGEIAKRGGGGTDGNLKGLGGPSRI